MADEIRVHAIISGRVQGVFFRMETKRKADACRVYGWVRNLPDGRVEAVFEGERPRVEEVVSWCHQGPPASNVKQVKISEQPFTGEWDSFKVTY